MVLLLLSTHTHHCIPIDHLSSTYTIYGDAYIEFYIIIAGGRVVDTHKYTPLYKVDVQKEGKVNGGEQLSHTGSQRFSVAVNFKHVTQNI